MDANLARTWCEVVILGFTGTQVGMTETQRKALIRVLRVYDITEFHHGDCIGADAQAHESVALHTRARIVIHPPVDERKRAWSHSAVGLPILGLSVLCPKPYLDRNKDIVNASEGMFAAPRGPEELRSGTWSTIRYARKCRKKVLIVWPDGSETWEVGRV